MPKKKPASRGTRKTPRKWSRAVTQHSHAMDLEPRVFRMGAREMAASVLRSATRSRTRKATPFRSAMSMLSFYENRAGANLSAERRRVIQHAKEELRKLRDRSS